MLDLGPHRSITREQELPRLHRQGPEARLSHSTRARMSSSSPIAVIRVGDGPSWPHAPVMSRWMSWMLIMITRAMRTAKPAR
jgi:hypothetical protein